MYFNEIHASGVKVMWQIPLGLAGGQLPSMNQHNIITWSISGPFISSTKAEWVISSCGPRPQTFFLIVSSRVANWIRCLPISSKYCIRIAIYFVLCNQSNSCRLAAICYSSLNLPILHLLCKCHPSLEHYKFVAVSIETGIAHGSQSPVSSPCLTQQCITFLTTIFA